MILTALSFPINIQNFHDFLVANVPHADGLVTTDYGYEVIEKTPFNGTDISTVQTHYDSLTSQGEAAKSQPTALQSVSALITGAGNFGMSLTVMYASSNVLQGITQAGKTQEVADYLKNVAYYLHNGSLYAAIAEMNNMINDTSDNKAALSPYVTNTILYQYLNKIQTYLGLPLTVDPGL